MKHTSLTNEQDRCAKIIEYIGSNQGCNLEDIVRGTESNVSRMTVYKILRSLEKVGAIRRRKEKPNSRDHKFFVDTNNPLISLPKEFDEFKKYYYSLLETVRNRVKEYLSYPGRDGFHTSMCFRDLYDLGLIFCEFIRIYDTRALLVWPKQIRDIESLKNLYMLLFSEVLEILGEIDKVFQSLFSDLEDPTKDGIFGNVGVGLLRPGFSAIFGNVSVDPEWDLSAASGLYNIGEHNDIEAGRNRVLEHISTILKKDYESYALKAANLVRKMDQQTGNYISKEEEQEREQSVHEI